MFRDPTTIYVNLGFTSSNIDGLGIRRDKIPRASTDSSIPKYHKVLQHGSHDENEE